MNNKYNQALQFKLNEYLNLISSGVNKVYKIGVEELVVHSSNSHSVSEENIDRIARDIFQNGQIEPIVINSTTLDIVSGNTRLLAMKRLNSDIVNHGKFKEIEFIFRTYSVEKELEIMLSANGTGNEVRVNRTDDLIIQTKKLYSSMKINKENLDGKPIGNVNNEVATKLNISSKKVETAWTDYTKLVKEEIKSNFEKGMKKSEKIDIAKSIWIDRTETSDLRSLNMMLKDLKLQD